jgi:endonuclease/exonuclease/phosphatase family metal-dependent hydrolase
MQNTGGTMPAPISFASFNLYNFQAAGKRIRGRSVVSDEDYALQRDWTVHKLRELNADVIAFQELWSKSCLDDVLSHPGLENYTAHYIKDDWYDIANALVVKAPWSVAGDIEVIKNFPFDQLIKVDEGDGEDDEVAVNITRFSRSVIKARLQHDDDDTPDVTVFACHLKSKMPARASSVDSRYQKAAGSALSTIRRTAEATALRIMLVDHLSGQGTPTVVLGDLNDDPLSNTLNIITDQPRMTKRSRGGDRSLYSALFLEQMRSFRDVFYTHEHSNHRDVLDHVLVSEEFFEHSTDSVWELEEVLIFNDHIDDKRQYTSDHGIIKASFR